MTKYDFKIRRGVFRSGNIKSKRDFQSFEKKYRNRRSAQNRLRNLIVMIVIVFLIIIIMFSVRVMSASGNAYQHELQPKNVNQIL